MEAGGSGVLGQPKLHKKEKGIMGLLRDVQPGYMKSHLKKKKKERKHSHNKEQYIKAN